MELADFKLVVRRGLSMVKDFILVTYGDAAFADVEHVKSQCGHGGGFALSAEAVEKCDYSKVIPSGGTPGRSSGSSGAPSPPRGTPSASPWGRPST